MSDTFDHFNESMESLYYDSLYGDGGSFDPFTDLRSDKPAAIIGRIVRETEKAYCINMSYMEHKDVYIEIHKGIWIPKSEIIEVHIDDNVVYYRDRVLKKDDINGLTGEVFVTVPKWLHNTYKRNAKNANL